MCPTRFQERADGSGRPVGLCTAPMQWTAHGSQNGIQLRVVEFHCALHGDKNDTWLPSPVPGQLATFPTAQPQICYQHAARRL